MRTMFKQIWRFWREKFLSYFPAQATPWYEKIFPNARIKYIIATGNENKFEDVETITSEGHLCYLIFIDKRWTIRTWSKGKRDNEDDATIKARNDSFASLRLAEAFPIKVLSREEKFCFKKMLGAAYVSAMEGTFSSIQKIKESALEYAKCRNIEQTRKVILKTATFLVLLAIPVTVSFYYIWPQFSQIILEKLQNTGYELRIGKYDLSPIGGLVFAMGFIGSYASLWVRFRRLQRVSYGWRWAIRVETFCRMLVGAIFAYIALLCVRCGILLPNLGQHPAAMALIGFAAGFSERLIPSVLKQITNEISTGDPTKVFKGDDGSPMDKNPSKMEE